MPNIHYLVRRSRAGWFNFTLISESGRMTGTVIVPRGEQSDAEQERQARDKIEKLSEALTREAARPPEDQPQLRLRELRPNNREAE